MINQKKWVKSLKKVLLRFHKSIDFLKNHVAKESKKVAISQSIIFIYFLFRK